VLRQACDEPLQRLQVGQPLTFRAFAKAFVCALGLLFVQGFDEQLGVLKHPLPLHTIGALVMLEPNRERSGREWFLANRREQGVGIGLVGARQRQQHSVGSPAGKFTAAHGIGKRLGQLVDQGQTTADPALVLAQRRCDHLLRQPLVHQTRQQPRLFDRLQRARLMLADDPQHGLIETAFGDSRQRPVPTQLAERLHPTVAIDQDESISVLHEQDWLTLPIGLQGHGKPADTRRIDDARRLEPPVQAVQIDFHGLATGAVHARHRTPGPPARP